MDLVGSACGCAMAPQPHSSEAALHRRIWCGYVKAREITFRIMDDVTFRNSRDNSYLYPEEFSALWCLLEIPIVVHTPPVTGSAETLRISPNLVLQQSETHRQTLSQWTHLILNNQAQVLNTLMPREKMADISQTTLIFLNKDVWITLKMTEVCS